MIRVLITTAGLNTAVSVIHALRMSKDFDFYIVAVGDGRLCAAAQLADVFFEVPPVNSENYMDRIFEICKKEKINFIFPLYSKEIIYFSREFFKFLDNSIHLLIPSPGVVELCIDKVKLSNFFQKNNFLSPHVYTYFNEISKFPVFIKPSQEGLPKNNFKINDKEELQFYLRRFPDSIIQEFIEGQEYTIDCFTYNENVFVCVPRTRIIVKDGKSFLGQTVEHDKLISQVESLLLKVKMNGPCNVQCIESLDGKLFFIEINPRLAAGGLPLTVEAGANIPEMMVRVFFGQTTIKPIRNYKRGLYMIRYLETMYVDK